MDLIYYLIAIVQMLIEFVIANIGFVIGILVIVMGMVSSRKKAKRAKQAQEVSKEYHQGRFSEYYEEEEYGEPPAPKPFVKSFKDLMAEIESELDNAPEPKPWDIPREGRGYSTEGRPQKTSSGFPEGTSAYPKKAPVQPKVRDTSVPSSPTVEPSPVFVPGDLTAINTEKPRKKTKRPNDLVTAVVMSEVLGTPKGLQD